MRTLLRTLVGLRFQASSMHRTAFSIGRKRTFHKVPLAVCKVMEPMKVFLDSENFAEHEHDLLLRRARLYQAENLQNGRRHSARATVTRP
jgi:hypothetical protein